VVDRTEGLFEVCRAVSPDGQQALREIHILLAANAIKALADGFVKAVDSSSRG
jgi:hypothetical protein